FTAADTVGRAQRVIDEEHERLHEITRRIRRTHDLGALAEALDDLNGALVEHFAHEEHPQGLYALLGVGAPENRKKFAAILAEHARILENVQSLVLKARRSDGDHRSLAEQAALLAHLLGDHERRENLVARAILGPAARG
ncbi:MAG TPA: hemerythrin domain-containing protein, partial [Anaeromyxobacteraceae bacterium]